MYLTFIFRVSANSVLILICYFAILSTQTTKTAKKPKSFSLHVHNTKCETSQVFWQNNNIFNEP